MGASSVRALPALTSVVSSNKQNPVFSHTFSMLLCLDKEALKNTDLN
jgi:hypothetical protein